jgi:hypothetical protein
MRASAVRIVGVLLDGKPTFHAASHGYGDYDTLCGIDANDPKVGHGGLIKAPRRIKIDCTACCIIWAGTLALKLRKSNFALASEASTKDGGDERG